MRITKKLLREIRLHMDERIKSVFALRDGEVEAYLKGMWPNIVPEGREENIKSIMRMSLMEFIPDHLVY